MVNGKKIYVSADPMVQNLLALIGKFCLQKKIPAKSKKYQYVIRDWSASYQKAVEEILTVLEKYVVPEEVEEFRKFKKEVLKELEAEKEEGFIPVYRSRRGR